MGLRGIFLLHALFFGILFAPFLGGGRLLGGDVDAALFHYPVMELFGKRAWSLDLLWNDLNFHGFPTFLGQAYPFHLLLWIFVLIENPVAALNWVVALYPLLGAFFFSILMREEGTSPLGSFVAGIAYAIAMRSWFFDATITGFLPLFPLLLLAIRHSSSKNLKTRWIAFMGGSAVIAGAWFMLHFHFTLILLIGAGLYCIAQMLRQKPHAWQVFLAFGGMVTVGATIGLLRLLPTLAYGLLSFRTEMPLSYVTDRGIGTRYPLLYLFPHFPFPLRGGADFSPYVGPIILACIITAIVKHWRERRVHLLIGIYVVTLILAMRHSPLYALLYQIPPFNLLRSPTRWPLLGTFSLAALAGMGFDAALERNTLRSRKIIGQYFRGIAITALCYGTTAALLPMILQVFPAIGEHIVSIVARIQPHVVHLETVHIASVIATTYSIRNPALLLPAIALLIGGYVFHPRIGERIAKTKRETILAAGAALTLLLVTAPAQYATSKEESMYTSPTNIQKFLREQGGLSLSFLPGSAMRTLFQTGPYKATLPEIQRAESSFLPANMNLFPMLPSADYYDRLGSKRMGRLLALVGVDRPSVAPEENLSAKTVTPEEKIQELRQRRYILDMLNVRHVISGWPLENVGFRKEFTEEVTNARIPVSVYANPSARPFAYFAKNVTFMEPDAEGAYRSLKDRMWSGEETMIECADCAGKKSFTANGTIKIAQQRPTFLEVQTVSPTPQWLVLSQNYLPGWKMQVDGTTIEPALPTEAGAKMGLAMSTFAAVSLPAGEHITTLTFSLKELLMDSWSLVIRGDRGLWR